MIILYYIYIYISNTRTYIYICIYVCVCVGWFAGSYVLYLSLIHMDYCTLCIYASLLPIPKVDDHMAAIGVSSDAWHVTAGNWTSPV